MPESTVREVFVVGEAEGAIPFSALLDQKTQLPELTSTRVQMWLPSHTPAGPLDFPKGVMLTHYNMVSMLRQLPPSRRSPKTRWYAWYRCITCTVYVVVNLGLSQGATIVTLPLRPRAILENS